MSEKIFQRDPMFRNGNLVEPELQDGILAKPTFDNDQIPNFSYLEGGSTTIRQRWVHVCQLPMRRQL